MLCATCHENKILFRAASGKKLFAGIFRQSFNGRFDHKTFDDSTMNLSAPKGTLDRLKVHQTQRAL